MNHIKNNSNPSFPANVTIGNYNQGQVRCFIADGSNNYTDSGIVENSLLYADLNLPFKESELNIFSVNGNFTVSEQELPNAQYIGRVIMSVNRYI